VFGGYNGFALSRPSVGRSVGPSVGRSFRPSPLSCPLYKSYTNRSIFSSLAEMFTSIRECAEPMLPMCQLKVNVKIEGQISNNQVLDIMSCLLCMSYTNWRVSFKHSLNFHFNKGICKTYVAHVSAQGKGYNWRSNLKKSNIRHYVVSDL